MSNQLLSIQTVKSVDPNPESRHLRSEWEPLASKWRLISIGKSNQTSGTPLQLVIEFQISFTSFNVVLSSQQFWATQTDRQSERAPAEWGLGAIVQFVCWSEASEHPNH